jgi:gamma-glutamyltranspeptidase
MKGGKAIAVPGEIQGFYEAWKIGGRLPWKQLFLPTINLCRKGISVGKALRRAITNTERFLEQFQSFRYTINIESLFLRLHYNVLYFIIYFDLLKNSSRKFDDTL